MTPLDVFDKTVDDILDADDYEKLLRQYSYRFYVPYRTKGRSFDLLVEVIGHEKASQLVRLHGREWLQVDWKRLSEKILSDVYDLAVVKKIPILEISELKQLPPWRVIQALSEQSIAERDREFLELREGGKSSCAIGKQFCLNDGFVRTILQKKRAHPTLSVDL